MDILSAFLLGIAITIVGLLLFLFVGLRGLINFIIPSKKFHDVEIREKGDRREIKGKKILLGAFRIEGTKKYYIFER